jgi:hypothetical protein
VSLCTVDHMATRVGPTVVASHPHTRKGGGARPGPGLTARGEAEGKQSEQGRSICGGVHHGQTVRAG